MKEVYQFVSFMFRWLSYLGIINGQEEDSFANYQDICKEAIELVGGAITPDDIVELKSKYYQELDLTISLLMRDKIGLQRK